MRTTIDKAGRVVIPAGIRDRVGLTAGSEIEITVDRGLLSLSGERRSDSSPGQQEANTYAQERFTGKFRRVISLPEDADPAKVEAKFRDGVLHVTVAKRESSKPRQITVS